MSSQEMKPFWVEAKAEHENGSGSGSGSGRGRGRRNNGKGPKKQPQRGLGVEQLERLRMEETLKKAAEASGIPIFHDQHQHLLQCYPPPPPPPPPPQVFASGNVPVRYGAPTTNGFQFPHQQNNNNIPSGSSGGLIGFNAWVVPNQQHNRVTNFPYGSAPLLCTTTTTPLVRIKNPLEVENSKELSSMPNLHSHQTFDLFLKKTRLNEDLRRDGPMEVWSNHVHNFFGFMPQPAVTPNLDECAEVVAVHRRGKSGGSTRVFMEYEFFPRKDDRGTTFKEQEFPTIASVVQLACNEPSSSSSSLTLSPYEDTQTPSHSIDLSLKL